MPGFDLHQHLWPESFAEALAARSRPPMLRPDGRGWRLILAGEPSCEFVPSDHDPDVRARALERAGLHRAALAPSSPLGIEGLHYEESAELLEAWLGGVLELGEPFAVWGALPLVHASRDDAQALLDRGAIGITLPAGAFDGPVRRRAAGTGARGAGAQRRAAADPSWTGLRRHARPARRPGIVVARADRLRRAAARRLARVRRLGSPAHPRLRVVFAVLAGGAPLQAERIAARGGPADAMHDPLLFYDTSSYGPRALDGAIRAVGIDALVYGSDAPVVDAPVRARSGTRPSVAAVLTSNPARLLHGSAAPPARRGWTGRHDRPARRTRPDVGGARAFVREIARRAGSLAGQVSHDPDERVYEELLRDDHVAVWLICWMHDHDTGFHDHDISAGAIAVAAGAVREDRLVLGGEPTSRTLETGDALHFRPTDIHRVLHAGDEPAVTIHAYSPPLWRMGAYEVREGGELARHSVSYAEELRPLNELPAAAA